MQSLESKCEFSIEHYGEILEKIIGRCGTASEKKEIILTHDIDILPLYALQMAKIEHQHAIKSTYYAFLHSELYNALSPENMNTWKEIKSLGHEIAFHYDTRYDQKTLILARFLIPEIDNNHISQHFIDLSPKPIIPENLIDRRSFTEQGYHYIADSGGWFRDGCFCKHLDKKLLIVCHPVWWLTKNFTQVYYDASEVLNKATDWWRVTVNEHRKQSK